jgi:hypothetical protein
LTKRVTTVAGALVLALLLAAPAFAQTIAADLKLIGADADALGKNFVFGDLNGDGRPDLIISGCGP